MTLDEIRKAVNFRLNKDYSGQSLTPVKFNTVLQIVNLEYFKVKYGLPESYEQDNRSAAQAWEVTRKISDDLRPFLVSMDGKKNDSLKVGADGFADLPTDYAHVSSIGYEYRKGKKVEWKVVEPLTNAIFNARRSSFILTPSLRRPVCTWKADTIHFLPENIGMVGFDYLRNPKTPVYAVIYNVLLEIEQYDAANSTELEWPENTHPDIVNMIVSYTADNLRVQDGKQSAEIRKVVGQ